MGERLSDSIEDYLKAIYDLSSEAGRATTSQLSRRLGVAPASITGMIQKMAASEPPLVEYQKHRGVTLTLVGEQAALEVIRHHRLLELFLQEVLGYTWDEVHAEADRLEHVISEDLEERIAQSLGFPLKDPHGEPIPARDLNLPPSSNLRLSDLRPNQSAIVEHVDATDSDLLRHLSSIGVIPKAHLHIVDFSPFDDNLRLQVGGEAEPIVLGSQITSRIFVEVLPVI